MSTISILIDESGDLGTNFQNNATKPYFIIGALVCRNQKSYKHISKSVERTIKNKLSRNKSSKNDSEIKGWKTSLAIKKYFYNLCNKIDDWELYFYALDKTKFTEYLDNPNNKIRIYNLLAKELIEEISFNKNESSINVYLDKHKSTEEEKKFNQCIEAFLSTSLSLNTNLNYYHIDSRANKGIQAIDLFCTGIYEKLNNNKPEWYKVFQDQIKFEGIKR